MPAERGEKSLKRRIEIRFIDFRSHSPFFSRRSRLGGGEEGEGGNPMEVRRVRKKATKRALSGETGGGRSGSRGTRWIQIIKFDWADLGRGNTSCVCIQYIDSLGVFSAYFPRAEAEERQTERARGNESEGEGKKIRRERERERERENRRAQPVASIHSFLFSSLLARARTKIATAECRSRETF